MAKPDLPTNLFGLAHVLKLNLTVGVDGDVVLGAGEVGVVGDRRVV